MPALFEFLGQSEKYIDFLFSYIDTFGGLLIFFGVFFFGEFAILVSIIQSGQGGQELPVVIMASVLGLMASDIFWFVIGRYLPHKCVPKFLSLRVFNPIYTFLETYTKDRLFLSLCLFKFFFGSRLAFVLYLSRQDITFSRFLGYNLVGTLIYISVLSTLGILFDSLVKDVFALYTNVVSILSLALILFFFSYLFRKFYKQ